MYIMYTVYIEESKIRKKIKLALSHGETEESQGDVRYFFILDALNFDIGFLVVFYGYRKQHFS